MFHQKISVFHIHPESLFKIHSKPSVDIVRILYRGIYWEVGGGVRQSCLLGLREKVRRVFL